MMSNLAINLLVSGVIVVVLLGVAVVRFLDVRGRRTAALGAVGDEIVRRRTRAQVRRHDLTQQAATTSGLEEHVVAGEALARELGAIDDELRIVEADVIRLWDAYRTLDRERTWGISPHKTVLASIVRVIRRYPLQGAGLAMLLAGTMTVLQLAGVLPEIFP